MTRRTMSQRGRRGRRSEKFWAGKLRNHPEIITQGETLEELGENMKEAYTLMTLDDVPLSQARLHALTRKYLAILPWTLYL